MEAIQQNESIKFYKEKYFITFYDSQDEWYVVGFNNIIEICKFKKLEVTTTNLNLLSVELYRALKREKHSTHMIDGSLMHVHLVDMIEDDE